MAVARSRKKIAGRVRRRKSYVGKLAGWKGWLILALCVIVAGLFTWAMIVRSQAPTANTALNHFDAIIVLGTAVDKDGNPSPWLLARVTEGVREYERGVAPRLILSGGPEPNHFIEADVMARAAESEGIPASAIIKEARSKDTIQNSCYSLQIMQGHGWHSAEIVSSASHLPRAGIIFDQLPIRWRTHAAPPVEHTSALGAGFASWLENLKTVRYLLWARRTESCAP